MSDFVGVVIVDWPQIAERGETLFPGRLVLYRNGHLPLEALETDDCLLVSRNAEQLHADIQNICAAQCKLVRYSTDDISGFRARQQVVDWHAAGGIIEYKGGKIEPPTDSAPQDVGRTSADNHASATPVGAEPSQEGSGSDYGDFPPLEAYEQDAALESAQHDIRMASARKSQAHADGPEEWPDPADFWGSKPLPAFNPEWAIPCLRSVSANNAAMIGCDQGIDYLQRIAFAAGCLSDDIKVRVRANQNWTESARIWACIVGDSGDGKSPSMVGITGPSRDLRFEIAERSKEKFAKYKAEYEVYELDRKAWVMAKHKGDPVGLLPVPPAKPVNELLYFSSTTSEGLLEQQEQSTRGTMLEADEVIGWAAGMDQYKAGGKGSDKAFWLSSWNGAEYVGILVGKLRTIHNTGVTIIGGTQPTAIRSAMKKSNFTTEDGLVQRFLFHVSNGLADEDSEQPADRDAIARWKNIIHRLYAMKPHLQPCEFTPEAHAIRQKMNDWLNRLRAIHTIPDAERQALAKWRAYFPRIALTLHAIQAADSGCEIIPAQIDAETAEFTYRYMTECLWPSMDHFYGEALENTEDMRSLRGFAEYCLARDKRMIITTELSRNWSHYRGIKSINLRREFWASVVMSGWARPVGTIARNEGIFSRYEVNPLAFDGRFGERAAAAKVAAQAYRQAMHPAMNRREPGEEG